VTRGNRQASRRSALTDGVLEDAGSLLAADGAVHLALGVDREALPALEGREALPDRAHLQDRNISMSNGCSSTSSSRCSNTCSSSNINKRSSNRSSNRIVRTCMRARKGVRPLQLGDLNSSESQHVPSFRSSQYFSQLPAAPSAKKGTHLPSQPLHGRRLF